MSAGDFTYLGTQKASQTYLQTMFLSSTSHRRVSHPLLSSSKPFFLHMHDTHYPGCLAYAPSQACSPQHLVMFFQSRGAEGPRRITPPSSTFTPPPGSHFVVSSSLVPLTLGKTFKEYFPLITTRAIFPEENSAKEIER